MATTGLTLDHQRPPKLGTSYHQLLPGLPNEITLDKIAPKLSWIDFYTLSLVSPAWWQANRSRQVYDARARSQSTETLAVFNYCPCEDTVALVLFSTKGSGGRFFWELPPIPGFERGIPEWCGCVTLDGKVYVLGGGLDSVCKNGGGKVFVMDVAGQRGWKKCTSMEEARQAFGCCVKDGKIYVFGGMFGIISIRASEVYDPKEDIWSPLSRMPSSRYVHNVELMGDEFVMHSGNVWDPVQIISPRDFDFGNLDITINKADCLEIYNPVEDEWTVVRPFRQEYSSEIKFISQGKFYVLNRNAVYHGEGHDWLSSNDPFPILLGETRERIGKRFCSCVAIGELYGEDFFPVAALPLNDELLVLLDMLEDLESEFKTYLVLGKGFRTSNEEILMEVVFECKKHSYTKQFIVPVEL